MLAEESFMCLSLVYVLCSRSFGLFSRIEREEFEMAAPLKDGSSTQLIFLSSFFFYQCFSENFSLVKDKTQEIAGISVNSNFFIFNSFPVLYLVRLPSDLIISHFISIRLIQFFPEITNRPVLERTAGHRFTLWPDAPMDCSEPQKCTDLIFSCGHRS